MNISSEIRDKILQVLNIVDVIGEAVDLHPRGANYWALCPFHNEKTPSFSVSADKGIYKCFGCGVSGNVITFQMEYYRMNYAEALTELAKKAGIPLDDFRYSPKDKEQLTKREQIIKILRMAADYYMKMLHATSGKHAYGYIQKREFSEKLVDMFELGYSPDSWDALTKEMRKNGVQDSILVDAGLVIEKDGGEVYDRFRNRLIFPIHDHLGKISGFGARLLDDEIKQAKYINSPQTDVYDKSKILYGLYHSKDEIRKKGFAILTEGYADVLTLFQAGYQNTVASSGTSLTKEQLVNLYRFCKTIYFVYDADSAGIKAAERGLELALEHGFNVMIVQLPGGEDPDSIIRKLGARNFQVYLDAASQFLDFLVAKMKLEGTLNNPARKAESIRALLNIIMKIPDRLQHDEYIRHLATLMNLSERQVDQIYKEKSKAERSQQNPKEPAAKVQEVDNGNIDKQQLIKDSDESIQEIGHRTISIDDLLSEEKLLIQLLLFNKESFRIMSKKFGIKPDDLITDTGKKLLAHAYRMTKKYDDVVKNLFDDDEISKDERDIFSEIVFSEDKPSTLWENFSNRNIKIDLKRIIQDTVYRLEIKGIETMQNSIQQQLKKEKSYENQMILMREKSILGDKKKEIEELLIR